MSNLSVLTNDMKHEILEKVLAALQTKFYKPELLNARWNEVVAAKRQGVENAPTREAFEEAVSSLLKEAEDLSFRLLPCRGPVVFKQQGWHSFGRRRAHAQLSLMS